MDIRRFLVSRGVAWGVMGLAVGGLATDALWRWQGGDVEQRLAESEARAADQAGQIEELTVKLTRAESELKGLRDELNVERDLRRRLEEVVSRGRK
ncbi:MAG: hypothetical protein HYU51_06125 [Candidatus Rokubacteria bacterium]|nr:hypothetical protein [Candidatus Rokubacteria bacterium]